MLQTSVEGIWVLQALVGVESMPVSLHLKPFIPSAHGDLIVETTAGRQPIAHTAQYQSLAEAGAIDTNLEDETQDYFLVGQVPNGTSSFVDNMQDIDLQGKDQILFNLNFPPSFFTADAYGERVRTLLCSA